MAQRSMVRREVNSLIKRKTLFIKNWEEKINAHLKTDKGGAKVGMPQVSWSSDGKGNTRKRRSKAERERQQKRHQENRNIRAELYAKYDKPSLGGQWLNVAEWNTTLKALSIGSAGR